jgi:hypothetical protein
LDLALAILTTFPLVFLLAPLDQLPHPFFRYPLQAILILSMNWAIVSSAVSLLVYDPDVETPTAPPT